VIYTVTYAWIGLWTLVFAAGTVWNLTHDVPDADWERFWRFYVVVELAAAAFVVVWFTIGGIRDIRHMLKRLAVARRDETDDGWVHD